jgi:TolA-binding protein
MTRRFPVCNRATLLRGLAILLSFGVISAFTSRAADDAQSEQAFNVASQAFQDEFWEFAAREFAAFVAKFPESGHVSEAILLQAQSRFQLRRYSTVVDVLTEKLSAAGALSEQYRYWIAEAQFQRGNFAAAADAYAELLRQSPNSPLRLKAGYGEAFARFQLGELAQTVELLQKPNGNFQQAARNSPAEEAAIRGYLLLGEALYKQKNYPAATQVLNQLASRAPSASLRYRGRAPGNEPVEVRSTDSDRVDDPDVGSPLSHSR